MTDEAAAIQKISRANRAKALVEDELFREAFQTLERNYMDAWAASAPHEQRLRENLYQALQILGDVRGHLGKIMSDGKVAQAELNELANRKRPKAA